MQPSEQITTVTNCKSCDFQFVSQLHFCPNCGAKVITQRLTVKQILQQFYQNTFNVDSKFVYTLRHLIVCPEKVFNAFISGARKKYYNPVSLIAIAIVVSTLASQLLPVEELLIDTALQEKSYEIGYKSAGGSEEDYNKLLQNEDFKNKKEESEAVNKKIQKATGDFTKNNLSLLAYLNLPIYALIAFLVFRNKKRHNYAETLVIVLYQNALTTFLGVFVILLFLLLEPNPLYITAFSFIIVYLYSNYSFRRLYNLNFSEIIIANIKFFVVSTVLFILFILIVIVVFITIQMYALVF